MTRITIPGSLTEQQAITPAAATIITPSMAQEILDKCNVSNRRLRQWWSIALASAISRGEWILTHQGIALDADGRLLDGQHRLRAIVAAGVPVPMFVFTGLDPRGFMTIDTGVKRSTADTTGLNIRTAEVCRKLAGFVGKGGATSSTAQQALDVAAAGVQEIHDRLMEYCPTAKRLYSSATVRSAAVLLVLDGHKEETVFKMYRDVLLHKFEELPPVGLAFIRQGSENKLKATGTGHDLLARSLKFLNPNNANLTKIQVSEADATAAAAYARDIIRRAVAAHSAQTL